MCSVATGKKKEVVELRLCKEFKSGNSILADTMVKKGKLRAALDAHKGRDYEKERQKKMQKEAEKKKRANGTELQQGAGHTTKDGINVKAALDDMEDDVSSGGEDDAMGVPLDGEDSDESEDEAGEQLQREEQEAADAAEEDDEEDEDDEDDVPVSDLDSLGSDDREDILPHQRLTINNTSALLKAHKSIALPSSLPFSATQAVVSAEQIQIPDINDDLNRELAFYKQSLDAAIEGRNRLKKERVPYTRPNDFFAEMVKNDEHMGKVKAKMVEAAAGKKAAAEARKQRDLKKFGKQVQVAKQQERDKAKRETLDKINILKRKRKDMGDTGGATEADMFDVALDDETKDSEGASGSRNHDKGGSKRSKKDAKFGFGGKKRFAKSNDAMSSGDLKGFSVKKMKSGPKKFGKSARPGKSKRAKIG